MNLRVYIFSILAALASIFAVDAAAWKSSKYQIDDLRVSREHGLLKVDMNVSPKTMHIGLEKQVVITPVIKSLSSADSIVLPSVAIAGRNSYYNSMRDKNYNGSLLRAGKDKAFDYAFSTEWLPWMEHSRLDLQCSVRGCCGLPENEDDRRPVALIDWRANSFVPEFRYSKPAPEGPKARKLEGKAYVSFPVNRTEIYPDYMINPAELRKITRSIDTVRLDPDATVKSITLTGFASPEGPYKNNVRLAAGRTEAVKEYVRGQYTFPASTFKANSVPEDWQRLRDSVAVSILPDRAAILDFIDNGNVPIERRNDELRKRFPTSYAYLLKHIYPWLRHTNYVIDYEIRQYNDIDEIMQVYKTHPEKLSLNEFYRAANTFQTGSPEFNEVMETALIYNKNSETANINAANAAMIEGDLKRARVLLNRVSHDPTAIYGLAVLDAIEGNYNKAAEGFNKARKAGIPEAEAALKQVQTLGKRIGNVQYYTETQD